MPRRRPGRPALAGVWSARLASVVVGVIVSVSLAGCTTAVDGRGHRSPLRPTAGPAPVSSSATGSASVSAPAATHCPVRYAAPDPARPQLALAFTVSADHTTVTGTEHVRFTPDLAITELVFRLTANTASSVAAGNRIVVTAATASNGAGAARYELAGAPAGTAGGLLRIAFAAPVPAGTTVTADLAFTVTLGHDAFDRFGEHEGYAWFGSAQPLLAWQRGYGWHTEPLIAFAAESATSEAADTTLSVTAPAVDTVIMSGDPVDPPPAAGGTRTWTAHITAARDVAVASGPFQVSDTMVAAGGTSSVRLRIGAPDAATRDGLVPQFQRAMIELAGRFGPFPFPSLAVARVPAGGGGIEYPGAILMLDVGQLVAVHETAHQWFYAMVGNSQAEHAWLDEAFASYAEQSLDDDAPDPAVLTDLAEPVDKPTAAWGTDERGYYRTTYDKGSAALFAARAAAGPDAFDAAVRCYVNANAWRVATPADLAAALSELPAAVRVLQQAGALR